MANVHLDGRHEHATIEAFTHDRAFRLLINVTSEPLQLARRRSNTNAKFNTSKDIKLLKFDNLPVSLERWEGGTSL